jgi:Transposase domain (DUF772)
LNLRDRHDRSRVLHCRQSRWANDGGAIAWRAADSFAVREFLGLALPEAVPDHSTISRTRRLIDVETHEAVFTWILQRLANAGLVQGKTVGIDATTLEANAALRSIVRRDTDESYYQDFLIKLAQESGIERPSRADLARIDRKLASAVRKLILKDALIVVGAGLLAGSVAAALLAVMLRSLLAGVTPVDLVAIASVSGVLLMATLLASWIPVTRASSTDPNVALRRE